MSILQHFLYDHVYCLPFGRCTRLREEVAALRVEKDVCIYVYVCICIYIYIYIYIYI